MFCFSKPLAQLLTSGKCNCLIDVCLVYNWNEALLCSGKLGYSTIIFMCIISIMSFPFPLVSFDFFPARCLFLGMRM